ncbi:MAG: hypothetical protein ACFFFT_01930 [Candidatus Thorarchaeota archaeon]
MDEEIEKIFKREQKILEEIAKNDEDYNILLERKKAGEPVEDLREQNRAYAEILAKKEDKYIEEIYLIISKIGNDFMNNEENYKRLLERRNRGEYVDDLIKQNRYTAQVLREQNREVLDESLSQGLKGKLDSKNAEVQREIQPRKQILKLAEKNENYLQNFMKYEMEYEKLSKRKKKGEKVEDLIKQNRIYTEQARRNYIKNNEKAKEWLKMNPDVFQDPMEKRAFLMVFRPFPDKNKKQIKKEKKKRKSQKCPHCKILMNYVRDIEGYQCPKCKKKFYVFEYKLKEL